jgi:hypothetical protein
MSLELVSPLIGLTFLAVYAMAGRVLVQNRRESHRNSDKDCQ